MFKIFNLKRYIQLANNNIIDTNNIFPHLECYFIKNENNNLRKLYFETVLGEECYLGDIIKESDNLLEINN